MGAYATALPGGLPVDAGARRRPLGASGASTCPTHPGLTAPEMVEAAERGELDVLWVSGGNFLDVLPDPARVERALEPGAAAGPPGHRAHHADAGAGRRRDPPAGRHPLRAGGRRHRDHHRAAHRLLPGDPPPGRRGPQRVAALRRRGQPGPARPPPARSPGPTTRRCGPRSPRSSRSTPASSTSGETGDQVQWGGRHLCAGGVFPTADGRARFSPLIPVGADVPDGHVHRRHPAGQAVQLDGLAAGRSAHRRPPRRRLHRRGRRRRPGAGRGRPRACCATRSASWRAG